MNRSLPKAAVVLLLTFTVLAFIWAIFDVKTFVTRHDFVPAPLVDLEGEWDVCAIDGAEQPTDACKWQAVHLPESIRPRDATTGPVRWFLVKRSFTLPADVLPPQLSLVMGDVGMLVSVTLNGAVIGDGGLFPSAHHPNRLYPLVFDIPGESLRPAPASNDLRLQIFAIAKSQSGPYKGPLGLFDTQQAKTFARSQTLSTIFMPLSCAIALTLIVAAVALYSIANDINTCSLLWFGAYCLSHIVFLLSFADIQYETVPMRWAVWIRFLTGGRLVDIALFAIMLRFSRFTGVARKIYASTFAAAVAVAVATTLLTLGWACSSARDIEVGSMTQQVIEVVWRLKFVSTTTGIALSLWFLRGSARLKHVALFCVVFAALYYDSAVLFRLPYGDYASRFYAVIMSVMIGAYMMREATTKSLVRVLNLEKDAEIGRSAAQVAHDIRSPLAALSMVTRSAVNLKEDERLILRRAADRIAEIADDLLRKRRSSRPASSASLAQLVSVPDLAETVALEARVRWSLRVNLQIETDFSAESYGLFAEIEANGLKRALSNVINNAVEACSESGKVILSASGDKEAITVVVADTGKGMPAEVIEKLGELGATHGKLDGNGIGTHHAIHFMRRNQGNLRYLSEEGRGTKAIFELPRRSAPAWFPAALDLYLQQSVVVLDDDESIHQVWRQRLSEPLALSKGKLFHHKSHKTFSEDPYVRGGALCLIDYELIGTTTNGLDLIRKLAIRQHAILVTSHADDPEIQSRCEKYGIVLLSKNATGLVPICLQHHRPPADFLVLDDDPLVHAAWRIFAGRQGKKLLSFYSSGELAKYADSISRAVPCYIDFHLGEPSSGIDVCTALKELGFQNISLATGESDRNLPPCPWPKVGKGPPQACTQKPARS